MSDDLAKLKDQAAVADHDGVFLRVRPTEMISLIERLEATEKAHGKSAADCIALRERLERAEGALRVLGSLPFGYCKRASPDIFEWLCERDSPLDITEWRFWLTGGLVCLGTSTAHPIADGWLMDRLW